MLLYSRRGNGVFLTPAGNIATTYVTFLGRRATSGWAHSLSRGDFLRDARIARIIGAGGKYGRLREGARARLAASRSGGGRLSPSRVARSRLGVMSRSDSADVAHRGR